MLERILPLRNWRWQFSLRALLLLTLLVGVGLTIYRWPWVEEKQVQLTILGNISKNEDGVLQKSPSRIYQILTRTTYRRDWRGGPVKHGLEQSFRNGELWHEVNYYDGLLQGRRRVWNWEGAVAVEADYRGGLLHGMYRTAAPWRFEGQYKAGNWDGEWRGVVSQGCSPMVSHFQLYVDDDGAPSQDAAIFDKRPLRPVEMVTCYRNGQRHGTTLWRALDGELLNTAEFAGDELVTWNGQPVVAQFREWLDTLNDPLLVAQLNAATDRNWKEEALIAEDEMAFGIKNANLPRLHVQLEGLSGQVIDRQRGSLTACLCEHAVMQGYGFDYRYRALWMVPRETDPAPPFVDPTGVSQIAFTPGSKESQEWEEVIDVAENHEAVGSCVAQLFEGTSITFEQQLKRPYTPVTPPPGAPIYFRRSRRDALGYVLYRAGCRCDLETGKLIIRMREGYDDDLANSRPLTSGN